MDVDKGFLEEDIWVLRSESIVITKKMEGKGRVEGSTHSREGHSECQSPVLEGMAY